MRVCVVARRLVKRIQYVPFHSKSLLLALSVRLSGRPHLEMSWARDDEDQDVLSCRQDGTSIHKSSS